MTTADVIAEAIVEAVLTRLDRLDDWPPVLDTQQAAALLQVTEDTVQREAAAGRLPACKVGRAWRFSRDELLNLIAGRDQRPTLKAVS